MSRLPLSGPDAALQPFGPGLHSLSVSTCPQTLKHISTKSVGEFLAEIGREDVLLSAPSLADARGNIRETYRRYAKTLVHFSDQSGEDYRVGLSREWVWRDGAFKLFAGQAPSAHQRAQVICRAGPHPEAVTRTVLHTGEEGSINPSLPAAVRCLINSLSLEHDVKLDQWHSDWVSVFLMTP